MKYITLHYITLPHIEFSASVSLLYWSPVQNLVKFKITFYFYFSLKSCIIPIFVNASRSILTIIITIFIQIQIIWGLFYKLFAPHADHLHPTLNFYSTKNFSKLGHRAQMVLCSAQTSLWNWPVLEPSLYHSCFLIVCWA